MTAELTILLNISAYTALLNSIKTTVIYVRKFGLVFFW
jgi:hypothetical protein